MEKEASPGTPPPKELSVKLRHYVEMKELAILRVDNLTCLANVTAKHFFHVTAFCL